MSDNNYYVNSPGGGDFGYGASGVGRVDIK